MQVYRDPTRANDATALPDVEVFYWTDYEPLVIPDAEPGYYWWTCLPGCLPDSEPSGPYATEADAIEAAQDIH